MGNLGGHLGGQIVLFPAMSLGVVIHKNDVKSGVNWSSYGGYVCFILLYMIVNQ